MDHLSTPVSTDQHNEPHNYPASGPKYGDSGSSLVNSQNLPTDDDNKSLGYTAVFNANSQPNVNGDNAHPCAEGEITFANGPAVNKTQVAPKAGAPGPM